MIEPHPHVLAHFSVLADATRCRLLMALDGHELTVSELCSVLELPQSTISRHLKTLAHDDWIDTRPDGTRRLYSLDRSTLGSTAQRLWTLACEQVGQTRTADRDARRRGVVLERRRARSREFVAAAARRWDSIREELFGSRAPSAALVGLLDPDQVVADLGCGTGPVSESIAPFVKRVYAIDVAPEMLTAARARLTDVDNVELVLGELERLPLADAEVDTATVVLVLHHVADPVGVLGEAARILRPGGTLLVVDLLPHDKQELRDRMGHVWLGFSEAQIERMLRRAGFESIRTARLPAGAGPGGVEPFVARATLPL